jgi:hypothetical protein
MTKSKASIRVRTQIRAGGQDLNHHRRLLRAAAGGIRVRTEVRTGGASLNHSRRQLAV